MRLLIVTAMLCEARPVMDRLKLKGEPAGEPFRLYRREDVALVISGMGKAAAAAATAWAAERIGREGPLAFLNFGSAGHGHFATGEVFVAQEVLDQGSGRKWFPPLVFDRPCPAAPVTTVDRIETVFEGQALYEMEASGFMETAQRFTTAELVHCVKFVSDNSDEPVATVDLERIGILAEQALDTLLAVISEVRSLAKILQESHPVPDAFQDMMGRWRFSVTQGRQLRRLLERWSALSGGRPLPREPVNGARSRREVLKALEHLVEREAMIPGSHR